METLQQKYMESLKSGIESLFEDSSLCDVKIRVNSQMFPCHKAVLAAISPYFKTMFTGSFGENGKGEITLQDIDEGPFKMFLKYVYKGQIDMKVDDVSEMLRLAALFQVDCLQTHCEQQLLGQLRVDNCLDLYRLSCMYNCTMLKNKSWLAILEAFCTVWKSDEFNNLTLSEVIAIIDNDSLVTFDEEHVCEAAIKWISADLIERRQYVAKIFCHVRLPHVSAEFIVNVLSTNRLLMENPDCRRLIDEAKNFHMLPARKLDHSHYRMGYRTDDDLDEVLLAVSQNDDTPGGFYEGGWCLWAYSYRQGRWFTLAQIPTDYSPGAHFAICSHGYDIYISGGEKNAKSLIKFECDRNEWLASPGQLKKARIKHCMVSVGNSLYCLGGCSKKPAGVTCTLGSVEEFYIPGQRWRTVAELAQPVHSAVTAVSAERVFVFGGTNKDDKLVNCVQSFHTRHREVTVISNLPYVSPRLMSVTISDKIYVFSGNGDGKGVIRLNENMGFEDSGFDLPTEKHLIGSTHYNEKLVIVSTKDVGHRYLGCIYTLHRTTSEQKMLPSKGNAVPKAIHACHRTYVDKRYLYHTYFQ